MTIAKRDRLFAGLAIPIFILPYLSLAFGAYRFLVATALICLCAAACYGPSWVKVMGLHMRFKQVVFCAITFAVALPCFYWLIQHAITQAGGHYSPYDPAGFAHYYGLFPHFSLLVQRLTQPLNEEIVLRALLLGLTAQVFSNRALLSISAALVFSSAHFVLYYFGALAIPLDIAALATLFFFSLAANALYLSFGHIGFGLALHVAWNWWRFSGDIWVGKTLINEASSFNLIEGSWPVLLIVAALSLMCLAGLSCRKHS